MQVHKSPGRLVTNVWQSLFNSEKVNSELNGEISVRTVFGYQAVMVDGYYQSGTYITQMLRKMLRQIPATHKVKNVLMLGLGGGGGVFALHRRFPNAHIVVVEHDPVMVELSKRLVFEKIRFTPEIILSDAQVAATTLAAAHRQFDVIVCDLFRGQELSPLLASPSFIDSIQNILAPTGYLAVNLFHHASKIEETLAAKFSLWSNLRYRYNFMQIYRHFGQGNVGDPIPNWFVSKQQSRTFLASQTHAMKSKIIGKSECLGLRYTLGQLALETYTAVSEPILEPWRGLRLIVWSPLTNNKPSKGWFSNPFSKAGWQIGITQTSANYWEQWSDHAQRHLKKWRENTGYRLSSATAEQFEVAYHASRMLDPLMRAAFMREIRSHLAASPEDVTIRLVTHIESGEVVAGLVTADYLDINQSCHLVSFIKEGARKSPVGYGLIADWYERTHKEGIRCLNFGVIAKTTDPKAWLGYSSFKLQFGLYLIKHAQDKLKVTLKP